MKKISYANIFLMMLLTVMMSACSPSSVPAPVESVTSSDFYDSPEEPELQVTRPDSHVVSRGETLTSIALNYGLNYRDLAKWNDLEDPDIITVNQHLRLTPPPKRIIKKEEEFDVTNSGLIISTVKKSPALNVVEMTTATPNTAIKPITSKNTEEQEQVKEQIEDQEKNEEKAKKIEATVTRLEKRKENKKPALNGDIPLKEGPLALRYPYSKEQLKALREQWNSKKKTSPYKEKTKEKVKKVEKIAAAQSSPSAVRNRFGVDWSFPTKGRIKNKFSQAQKGINFLDKAGSPVYAAADGKVIYVGTGVKAYGKLVIIKHNNDYLTAYAHNSEIYVKENDEVKRGGKISAFGRSGSDTVMLHFEVRKAGKPLDPMQVLPPKP